MALPAGNVVEQGLVLANTNIKNKISSLVNEEFTGYVAVTIEGEEGIEEGSLILQKGAVVGSTYELMKEDKLYFGEEAMKKTLNALAARFGIMDIAQLSQQQLQLVLALEDKIGLRKRPKDIVRSIPKTFSAKESKGTKEDSDVFKKFGLSELR